MCMYHTPRDLLQAHHTLQQKHLSVGTCLPYQNTELTTDTHSLHITYSMELLSPYLTVNTCNRSEPLPSKGIFDQSRECYIYIDFLKRVNWLYVNLIRPVVYPFGSIIRVAFIKFGWVTLQIVICLYQRLEFHFLVTCAQLARLDQWPPGRWSMMVLPDTHWTNTKPQKSYTILHKYLCVVMMVTDVPLCHSRYIHTQTCWRNI